MLQKRLGRDMSALHMVCMHHRNVIGQGTVQGYDRQTDAGVIDVHGMAAHNNAIDLVGGKHIQVFALFCRGMHGVAQNHLVSATIQFVLDAGSHGGKERLHHIGDNQSDKISALGGQASRNLIGLVVQQVYGILNGALGFFRHIATFVEIARHRVLGYSRYPRNVRYRGHEFFPPL